MRKVVCQVMDVMNQAKERDIFELVIKDGDLEGGAAETKLELSKGY